MLRIAISAVRRHVGFPLVTSSFIGRHDLTPPPYEKPSIPLVDARRHSVTKPNRRTTALTVITDMKHLRHSPIPALTLGIGGLLPFIGAPVYMILTQNFCANIAFVQLAYGASILSFLGGVRWGATLPSGSSLAPDWTNLIYSVSPSLVAWVGLLLPYPASTLTVISGLCGAAYLDLTAAVYPAWFKALRFLLTVVAVLGLWTTITIKYLIVKKEDKNDNDMARSEVHELKSVNIIEKKE